MPWNNALHNSSLQIIGSLFLSCLFFRKSSCYISCYKISFPSKFGDHRSRWGSGCGRDGGQRLSWLQDHRVGDEQRHRPQHHLEHICCLNGELHCGQWLCIQLPGYYKKNLRGKGWKDAISKLARTLRTQQGLWPLATLGKLNSPNSDMTGEG